jgi:hypothetical protein
MLIYYFELKKVAFWFIDFQQPSLGDIQMPLGLCGLPTAGRLCVLARYFIFLSRKGAETQRNYLNLPQCYLKIYFFSREGAKEKNNLAACLPEALRLCEHIPFFGN